MWGLAWTALGVITPHVYQVSEIPTLGACQNFWFKPSNHSLILAVWKVSCPHSDPEDNDCRGDWQSKEITVC